MTFTPPLLTNYMHTYAFSDHELIVVSLQDYADIVSAIDNKHPIPIFYSPIPDSDYYFEASPVSEGFQQLLKDGKIYVYDTEAVVDGGEVVMGIMPHWNTSAKQDFLDGRLQFLGDYVTVAEDDFAEIMRFVDAQHLAPVWYTYDEHETVQVIESSDPTFKDKLVNRQIYVFDSNAIEEVTGGGPGGHYEINWGDGPQEDYLQGYIRRRDV